MEQRPRRRAAQLTTQQQSAPLPAAPSPPDFGRLGRRLAERCERGRLTVSEAVVYAKCVRGLVAAGAGAAAPRAQQQPGLPAEAVAVLDAVFANLEDGGLAAADRGSGSNEGGSISGSGSGSASLGDDGAAAEAAAAAAAPEALQAAGAAALEHAHLLRVCSMLGYRPPPRALDAAVAALRAAAALEAEEFAHSGGGGAAAADGMQTYGSVLSSHGGELMRVLNAVQVAAIAVAKAGWLTADDGGLAGKQQAPSAAAAGKARRKQQEALWCGLAEAAAALAPRMPCNAAAEITHALVTAAPARLRFEAAGPFERALRALAAPARAALADGTAHLDAICKLMWAHSRAAAPDVPLLEALSLPAATLAGYWLTPSQLLLALSAAAEMRAAPPLALLAALGAEGPAALRGRPPHKLLAVADAAARACDALPPAPRAALARELLPAVAREAHTRDAGLARFAAPELCQLLGALGRAADADGDGDGGGGGGDAGEVAALCREALPRLEAALVADAADVPLAPLVEGARQCLFGTIISARIVMALGGTAASAAFGSR